MKLKEVIGVRLSRQILNYIIDHCFVFRETFPFYKIAVNLAFIRL